MLDTKKLTFETNGPYDFVDLSDELEGLVRNGIIESGIVTVFSHGSTTGITLIGSEEGILNDYTALLQKLVPPGVYQHDAHTDHKNGQSHILSGLIGNSVTLPFTKKRIHFGMFQRVYFVDFDTVKRERELIIQIIGE